MYVAVSADKLGEVLRQRWRARLTLMQPPTTEMHGTPRRPAHFGGVGPWLVAVLRGCAWQDQTAETLLDQVGVL